MIAKDVLVAVSFRPFHYLGLFMVLAMFVGALAFIHAALAIVIVFRMWIAMAILVTLVAVVDGLILVAVHRLKK